MAGVINPANIVWGFGYLFGTISGGGVDDVPFGQLQDFNYKDDIGLRELMGNTSLTAVAVGISDRKVTGDAKFATIRARQFKMMRGGTLTFSTNTTLAMGILDEPLSFNIHLKNPSDSSQLEMIFYTCMAPSLAMNVKLRDWVIPDFQITCYGNSSTGKLIDLLLPGDQTVS